jgi:DNA-binding FadR family transcriptional regulator
VTRGVLGGVVVHLPDQRLVARATVLVLQAKSVAISDVFDAYAVIEPAAARMVATSDARADAAKELKELVAEQERLVGEPARFTLARKRFHEEVVRLAGNQTLLMTVAVLNEVIERSVAAAVRMAVHEPASSQRAALRAQERLVELIVDGNGDGAQEHWNTYLASVRPHMLGNGANAIVDLDDHR